MNTTKKEMILKILTFIFALLNGIYQIKWNYIFTSEKCEWFQEPLPNYGSLLLLYNFMMICICVMALHMVLDIKFYVNNKSVLLLIFFQSLYIIFEAIYWCRFVYAYGEKYIEVVLCFLQPIPMLMVLLLYFKGRVSKLVVIFFVILDFALYAIMQCKIFSVDIFGGFFDFYNPFNDIFARTIFAILILFVILLNDNINKSLSL